LAIFQESTGIKKTNMPHGSSLAICSILYSDNLVMTPAGSNQIHEAYNLEYASCIGSLIYIISYTIPYISFSVNKFAECPLARMHQTSHAARTYILVL
jgi:hypothetical protein